MRWKTGSASSGPQLSRACVVGVLACELVAAPGARADWRVYLLSTGSSQGWTRATTIYAGRTGGVIGTNAALWEHPQAPPASLAPSAPWDTSETLASWGNTQVGWASKRDAQQQVVTEAAAWSGSAESFRSLQPASNAYRGSMARSIREQQVAGFATYVQTGLPHAALWTGPTFSTFVDLHNNTKAQYSECFATDGQSQGGWAVFRRTGQIHAALWHGTSASMTDVNPSWSWDSWILGMAPGAQVGRAAVGSTGSQPVLWHGSADSAVIMTPSGFGGGELTATDGLRHVGLASKNGAGYAGIWMSDDPNSFVNLAALVGNNVVGSSANAVYSDANNIYVAGQIRLGNGPLQGVVWVQELPAPGAAALMLMGVVVMGRRKR
ncbi:MAG: hypothetical protein HUU19_02170 [Phycisphaerales bacterium]|nr:hypothetical protein [Phycisphaerales bacterium]